MHDRTQRPTGQRRRTTTAAAVAAWHELAGRLDTAVTALTTGTEPDTARPLIGRAEEALSACPRSDAKVLVGWLLAELRKHASQPGRDPAVLRDRTRAASSALGALLDPDGTPPAARQPLQTARHRARP